LESIVKPKTDVAAFEAIHITTTDGDPRVSTETIADGVGIKHRSIMSLIRKHSRRLSKYGQMRFEISPRKAGVHGGNGTKYAMLNEHQATLLLTLTDNTEKSIEFKDALVYEFFRMREALRRQQLPTIPELKKLAQDGKEIGKEGSALMHICKRAKKMVDNFIEVINPQRDLLEDQAAELKRLNRSTRERQNDDKAARLAAPTGGQQ
jgi:phage regulator Rha-like protein